MLIDPDKLRDWEHILTPIVNLDEAKRSFTSALAAERHIILAGPPGCGKTTLAKLAVHFLQEVEVNACGYHCSPDKPLCPVCRKAAAEGKKMPTIKLKPEERFVRVQGSPDLTVEDLLGDIDPAIALQKGAYSLEAFKPGKIFRANKGILFFDELNRAPERVQNALLQVLEEGHATLGSYEVDMPAEFIVIATMNPKDASTERLSKVFLDRFDIIPMDYPRRVEDEERIIRERAHLPEHVIFPDELYRLIAAFIIRLRTHPSVQSGPSVRASIGLAERAAALALIENAPRVMLSHIRRVLQTVVLHRTLFKPGLDEPPEHILEDVFEQVVSEQGEGLHHRPS